MNETTAPTNHRPGRIGRQTAPWTQLFPDAERHAARDAARVLYNNLAAAKAGGRGLVTLVNTTVIFEDATTGQITRLTVTAEVL